MDQGVDGRVERLEATVATLLNRVAELSLGQLRLTQELDYLRERNRAMEMAMVASAALFEAISEPFVSLTEQTPS